MGEDQQPSPAVADLMRLYPGMFTGAPISPTLSAVNAQLPSGTPQSPDWRERVSNGLFGWWWYPFMDHIERLARMNNPGPVDARTQMLRDQWDAIIRARNAPITPSPFSQPNMTGARG